MQSSNSGQEAVGKRSGSVAKSISEHMIEQSAAGEEPVRKRPRPTILRKPEPLRFFQQPQKFDTKLFEILSKCCHGKAIKDLPISVSQTGMCTIFVF